MSVNGVEIKIGQRWFTASGRMVLIVREQKRFYRGPIFTATTEPSRHPEGLRLHIYYSGSGRPLPGPVGPLGHEWALARLFKREDTTDDLNASFAKMREELEAAGKTNDIYSQMADAFASKEVGAAIDGHLAAARATDDKHAVAAAEYKAKLAEVLGRPLSPDEAYAFDKKAQFFRQAERETQKPTNPKDAIGVRKVGLSCVPAGVLMDLALALMEGAAKYGRHNYRGAGVRSSVYYDAAMGHLMDWWEGDDLDAESGLSHITKAMASLTVLRDAMLQDMLTDDRPPRSKVFKRDFNGTAAAILDRHADKKPHHWTIADVIVERNDGA